MLRTPVCDLLGIEYPIFSVGFGAAAAPELAAAVSNAGGCGVVGGGPAEFLGERIRQVCALTDKLFGANVIIEGLADPDLGPYARARIEACLQEQVPLLVLFWGDPSAFVEEAQRVGTKIAIQVGSPDEAKAAADAGVDIVIAQGFEAGGHVRGHTALSVLVPAVVDRVKPVPVLASGGIADGRGLAAALALGAQGVSLGTRFVASEECFVERDYKDRVVASSADDTVYSELFGANWPDAPHRVIRNATVERWEEAGRPAKGGRPGEGSVIGIESAPWGKGEAERYEAFMATPWFDGDLDDAPIWAGQSCELVHDVRPAGEIVRDIVREASAVIAELGRYSP
ncbi:MAG: nitronate monooxygenase [Actinobacteria bacterium]|nr:nitronate monooxygenase [Actinomycetota bacterium]